MLANLCQLVRGRSAIIMPCDSSSPLLADLLSADMGVRIIHGSTGFILWQKYKAGLCIIFHGLLYLKFYLHLFPVCIASLLFSYSANSHKCVIKLSVSVSVCLWYTSFTCHSLFQLVMIGLTCCCGFERRVVRQQVFFLHLAAHEV